MSSAMQFASASTLTVAPLVKNIDVVSASLTASYESILVANSDRINCGSLTVSLSENVALENCAGSFQLLPMSQDHQVLLAANAVTLVKLTAVAVASLIVFN